MSARRNQRQQILNMLIAARGGEVPSYELAKCALQYCARISELRAQGFRITSRTERHAGVVHGFFRLEMGMRVQPAGSSSPQMTTKPKAKSATVSDLREPTLFDLGTPPHRDLG